MNNKFDIAICGGTLNNNYGATLTYYALYKFLEKYGYSVIIIPPRGTVIKKGMYPNNIFETNCNIAQNFFKSNDQDKYNEMADTFIIGSDQIWRNNTNIPRLGLKQYLDYISPSKRKIAYAVSYGTTDREKISECYPEKQIEIKRLIEEFDAISHREPECCQITENVYRRGDSVHTIDPVFFIPVEHYKKITMSSEYEKEKDFRDFLCFYTLRTEEKSYENVKKLADELRLDNRIIGDGIITHFENQQKKFPSIQYQKVPYAQDWLWHIKNSKGVITDSFHGICFCIIFNIPFICLKDPQDIRIKWILGSLGMMDHYMDENDFDISKAKRLLSIKPNSLSKLSPFIQRSKLWLIRNINNRSANKSSQYSQNSKFAVTVISKNEERYLCEWLDHYKQLGFNNILFFDNNDPGDHSQYDTIKTYIDEGFVKYHDWKDIHDCEQQRMCYKYALEKYKNEYDWIGFFDVDEFLHLEKHRTIQQFISSNKRFNNYDSIHFSWLNYTDSDKIYYTDLPVKTRFTSKSKFMCKFVKSLIRTNSVNLNDEYYVNGKINPHTIGVQNSCNVYGLYSPYSSCQNFPIHRVAYIKHYYMKTCEELIEKIKKGDVLRPNNVRMELVDRFFSFNKITDEKIKMIQDNFPDLDLTTYENKMKDNGEGRYSA